MEKLSRAKFIDKIKGIKFYVGSIWKKENDTMGLLEKTKMDLEILVNN